MNLLLRITGHAAVCMLAGLLLSSAQQPARTVDSADTIKWWALAYQESMDEGAEYMDREWSCRFDLADKTGVFGTEYQKLIKDAPRTIGDGMPYAAHYAKRADGTAEQLKKDRAKMKAFERQLLEKYGADMIIGDPETGVLTMAKSPFK